jgi:hypothetical protein
MRKPAVTTSTIAHEAERRWARVDSVVCSVCVALSALCFGFAGFEFVRGAAGKMVHPDAVLLPFAFGIPPAITGVFFFLARTAMRCRTAARWMVQWGAVLAPLIFAGFVWLSL